MKKLTINESTVSGTVVVGPNLNPETKKEQRWSARGMKQRGKLAIPQDMIAISDVTTVTADTDENSSGCSYRAAGNFIELADLPKGLRPVVFNPTWGRWCDEQRGSWVHVTHALFLPNGDVLASFKN